MRTSIKALTAAVLLTSSLISAPAFAQEETAPPSEFTFSGYVQGVSDYRFRGYSLSGGDPAIQGSINLNHASGFYVGAWASSIEDSAVFGHTELDLYAGWTGSLTPNITADVGLLYYAYPNGHVGDAEYFEPYASLATTYGPVSAKLGVAYAFEGQDALGNDDNLYVFTDVSAGLPTTPITLNAHLGYADGVQGPTGLAQGILGLPITDDDGFDYSVGASYNITSNLSVSAAYVGVDGPKIDDFNDDTVVATIKLAL
jgi:uncharacterized protein (TIGR02001 family)